MPPITRPRHGRQPDDQLWAGWTWDDASPVDYAAALAACTDDELSFLAEHSITLAAVQDDGIAEFGEALYRGVNRERLLRLSRIAEDLALFDAIVHHPPEGCLTGPHNAEGRSGSLLDLTGVQLMAAQATHAGRRPSPLMTHVAGCGPGGAVSHSPSTTRRDVVG